MANYHYFLLYALVRAKYFYVMDAEDMAIAWEVVKYNYDVTNYPRGRLGLVAGGVLCIVKR